MRILVFVKQVLDTGAKVRIKDGQVDPEGVARVLNPYDEYAVEEAVRIKEKLPESKVTLVTLGPERCKEVLKTGLAMGADKAVHLMDPAFEGLDHLGVAHALAKAARKLHFDLILCGRQAVDDDMAQVGPAVAIFLGIQFVTVVTELIFFDHGLMIEVTRQVEGGAEIIEAPVPLLVTCQKGLNEPRLPSLKGIMAAKKKEVTVMNAEEIKFDPEAMGTDSNRVKEISLSLPPGRDKGAILQGTVNETTAQLAGILRNEVKVI